MKVIFDVILYTYLTLYQYQNIEYYHKFINILTIDFTILIIKYVFYFFIYLI